MARTTKPNQFKDAIAIAKQDRRAEVHAAYAQVIQCLQGVNTVNLKGPDAARPQQINAQATQAAQSCDQQVMSMAPAIIAKANNLGHINLFRILGGILLAIIGIVLLFSVWQLGLVLLVIALIAVLVLGGVARTQAHNLAMQASAPIENALATLGQPETLHAPASGLYGQADALFLASLDAQSQQTEMMRRQMNKQSQQYNEQMAAMQQQMQQQMAVTKAALDESRAQTDMLRGPQGFIGSMVTTHDRIKQDQKFGS